MLPRRCFNGYKKNHPLQFNKDCDFIKRWTGEDSLPDTSRLAMGRESWESYLTWCKRIGYVFDEETKRFKEVVDEKITDVGRN